MAAVPTVAPWEELFVTGLPMDCSDLSPGMENYWGLYRVMAYYWGLCRGPSFGFAFTLNAKPLNQVSGSWGYLAITKP